MLPPVRIAELPSVATVGLTDLVLVYDPVNLERYVTVSQLLQSVRSLPQIASLLSTDETFFVRPNGDVRRAPLSEFLGLAVQYGVLENRPPYCVAAEGGRGYTLPAGTAAPAPDTTSTVTSGNTIGWPEIHPGMGTTAPSGAEMAAAGDSVSTSEVTYWEPYRFQGVGDGAGTKPDTTPFAMGQSLECVSRRTKSSGDLTTREFIGWNDELSISSTSDLYQSSPGASWNARKFFGFFHTTTDTEWKVYSSDGVAYIDHGLTGVLCNVLATPHTFRITGNADDSVQSFYIDGVLVKTVSTGLPPVNTPLSFTNGMDTPSSTTGMSYYYWHARSRNVLHA